MCKKVLSSSSTLDLEQHLSLLILFFSLLISGHSYCLFIFLVDFCPPFGCFFQLGCPGFVCFVVVVVCNLCTTCACVSHTGAPAGKWRMKTKQNALEGSPVSLDCLCFIWLSSFWYLTVNEERASPFRFSLVSPQTLVSITQQPTQSIYLDSQSSAPYIWGYILLMENAVIRRTIQIQSFVLWLHQIWVSETIPPYSLFDRKEIS